MPKAAMSFVTPGVEAFEPISKCTCLVAMAGEDTRLMISKRKLIGTLQGVNIGAVNFNYYSNENGEIDYRPFINEMTGETDRTAKADPLKRELAMHEVCAVKAANIAFRSVFYNDTVQEVRYDKAKRAYRTENNDYFRAQDVETSYFDSGLLKSQIELKEKGKPLTIPQVFFDWMMANKENDKLIDVHHELGKNMRHCINDVYNGDLTPISSILLPALYFCSPLIQNFNYKMGAVEQLILRAARSDESYLDVEFAPHKGVIVEITYSDDNSAVGLTIQRVEAIRNGTGPISSSKSKYKTIEKFTNIELPNIPGITELLVTATPYDVGVEVPIEAIVSRTTRIVRLVPCDPCYSDLESVQAVVGKSMIDYLKRIIIKQYTPNINGVPAIALNLLDRLPLDFNPNTSFFVRNQTLNYVFEGPKQALISPRVDHVQFDFIHHPWYKTQDQVRAYRQRYNTNSVKLGDMVALGSGDNTPQ